MSISFFDFSYNSSLAMLLFLLLRIIVSQKVFYTNQFLDNDTHISVMSQHKASHMSLI